MRRIERTSQFRRDYKRETRAGRRRRRKHRARENPLFEDRSKAGKHFLHDLIGDALEAPSLPGADIECPRLVATDHAGRSGACARERDGKATPAGEASTRGDGQDNRRAGQLVERRGRDDQHRPGSLLLMACGGIETDQPDVAPLHYSSSLPTGFASIQARSSADGASPGSSHCANSSSSEYLGRVRG